MQIDKHEHEFGLQHSFSAGGGAEGGLQIQTSGKQIKDRLLVRTVLSIGPRLLLISCSLLQN
jgi:hypothetical protein